MSEDDCVLVKKDNSSAKIHLFGATIVSWKVDDVEYLFVSGKSLFDNKKAIRGGVPFVFPQFGPWSKGPQHGFARISRWSISDEKQIGTDSITLILEDDEKSRSMWNNKFRTEYTITLGDRKITMNVKVTNTGKENLQFTLLLHTYFSVPDVMMCSVTGLKGCSFIDKVKNGLVSTEDRDEVKIAEFTDRVYRNTPQEHIISNVAGGKGIKLEKCNFPDTVIWNPWIENAKQMSDFGDDEWKSMICVEAGYVSKPVTVEPLKDFSASQMLSILD